MTGTLPKTNLEPDSATGTSEGGNAGRCLGHVDVQDTGVVQSGRVAVNAEADLRPSRDGRGADGSGELGVVAGQGGGSDIGELWKGLLRVQSANSWGPRNIRGSGCCSCLSDGRTASPKSWRCRR